jgi:hypothetical protein
LDGDAARVRGRAGWVDVIAMALAVTREAELAAVPLAVAGDSTERDCTVPAGAGTPSRLVRFDTAGALVRPVVPARPSRSLTMDRPGALRALASTGSVTLEIVAERFDTSGRLVTWLSSDWLLGAVLSMAPLEPAGDAVDWVTAVAA